METTSSSGDRGFVSQESCAAYGDSIAGRTWQPFYVRVTSLDTGEEREQWCLAADPEHALAKTLRRAWVAEWLLSEQRFQFVTSDRSTL